MPDLASVARASTLAAAALLAAAGAASAGDADARAFFEAKVRPLLAEHCLKCHGPDKQKGGLRLDSRDAALKGGEGGPAVVPGDPDASPLVQAVRYQDLQMPPAGKLPDAAAADLAAWVKAGAVWPDDKKPAAGGGERLASRKPGTITDDDRNWWAFRKPARPAAPAAGAGWAVNAIDRFVAAGHAAAGLTHAPEADRRVLARRVTFFLTGLPPTPAEVEAFAADARPDAYERLVERLLASPAYGERWARPWLDLVRYAESDGFRQDAYRPNAWRYRDYVVQSLNADKGFDRFAAEQLAGDELSPGDPDALVATGYLRHGPYEYNQRDVRTHWANILNDITDVTGDAFLGLGVSCARCHDHKFDPILQKDYYRLQAFFAGLHFTDEPLDRSASDRAAREAKAAPLRAKIEAMLAPARARSDKVALGRFPEDIQALFRKPAADRTPYEQQLVELANRQLVEAAEKASTKLTGAAKEEYEQLRDALEEAEGGVGEVMAARDLGPAAAETAVPGGRKASVPVAPGFPTVLGDPDPECVPTSVSTGRRAALAAWLTRPDNPLTARVIANRVWQGHFGRGLVGTPSDYGTLGEKPSHPELLDWLAVELVESGWSLKHLHRLIVTSATYRQAAAGDVPPAARLKDPENRLLWAMPVRRLDAEQVRDALLAAAGELDRTAGGPAGPGTGPRRSVYTRAARNTPDPLLASFDAADGLTSCARRNTTVTPTQSLLLLNGKAALERSKAFAARVMPADGANAPDGVRAAFRVAYGRPPTAAEEAEAMAFLRGQAAAAGRGAAWSAFCHALVNSNEFLYVD